MKPSHLPQLGINIDHIATLRQLRGTPYPDLREAVRLSVAGGADQITIHLREDRRHIQDADLKEIRALLGAGAGKVPGRLNLEMAATDEMLRIARRSKPDWSCLVPEKRQEVTTEGGLNLERHARRIRTVLDGLRKAGIRVSLFIEPSVRAVELAASWGADAVELHTGRYCLETQKSGAATVSGKKKVQAQLARIREAALAGGAAGILVHAGHGFDYGNVRPVAELVHQGLPLIAEYNIGHAVVCRAAMVGLERAVREMKSAILAP